jgi:hypothetical protein
MITALDPGPWWAWDPACGEGHLAHGLEPWFEAVFATDIFDYSSIAASCAAGGRRQQGAPLDFLSGEADAVDQVDWAVFNPPFTLAVAFVAAALRRARRGVAVLARSGWCDTAGRYGLFFDRRNALPPCDLELAFFDRVPMSLGRWEPKSTEPGGSSATPYSWFIWFQPAARPQWLAAAQEAARMGLPLHHGEARTPILGMGGHALIKLGIPPGTKARLTHRDDARDWGVRGETPLFDGER